MPVSAVSSMFSKTLQTDAGLAQSVIGGIGMSRRQKELNNLQNPVYTPNKAVADYYQAAKDRYNTNPYNTNYYMNAQRQAQQGLAAGINALGDRRSATGQIGALVGNEQNQLQGAGVNAEKLRNQEFGTLGQATNMKVADDRTAFEINVEDPFQRKYGELTQRLNNSRQLFNSGVSNLFGGLTGGGGQGLSGISSLPGARGLGSGSSGGGLGYAPSYSNSQMND